MKIGTRLALIAWGCGIVLCSLVIVGTRFSADMSAFLPRSPSQTQQVLVDQMQTGVASHLILVALAGEPTPTLAALSKALAQKLRADSIDFIGVNNGDQAVSGPPPEADLFWRNRYVLSPNVTADRFTADGLHQALEHDLDLLSSDMSGLVKQTLPNDPTGELLTLLGQLADQKQPASRDGVWFSPEGKRALLVAQTRQPGFDITNEERVLATVGDAFAAAQESVPDAAGAQLHLSGPGVFADSH